MDYRTLGNSGCAVSTFALGTMTFGAETDEAGRARAARPVRRGRRHAGRHRRCVLRRAVGGDHRPLARRPPGRHHRAGGAGHQGPLPDGRRPERRRAVRPAPDPGAGRVAAPAGRRRGRPVPGARVRPAHPAGGDAAHPRRLRPRRQDPLLRAVELHRLAADQGRAPGPRAERRRPGDPAAAVQPAGAGDRVGDRAGRAGRRPRAAALEPARRRLAVRQVPARRAARRRHPARRGPGPRHGGLRPARHRRGPGTSSTRCRGSPTTAACRWPRSRWPG